MIYEEQREKSRRMMNKSQGLVSIVFGIFMMIMGVIFFDKNHFGIAKINQFLSDKDPLLISIFGVVSIIYGTWRVYRGYHRIKE